MKGMMLGALYGLDLPQPIFSEIGVPLLSMYVYVFQIDSFGCELLLFKILACLFDNLDAGFFQILSLRCFVTCLSEI